MPLYLACLWITGSERGSQESPCFAEAPQGNQSSWLKTGGVGVLSPETHPRKGTSHLVSEGTGAVLLPGWDMLGAKGREQSSPDLCSHHPAHCAFYTDRGNDFNVPVNKLSGRISLSRQAAVMASPPRRCPARKNQASAARARVPPVPIISRPFNKASSEAAFLRRGGR